MKNLIIVRHAQSNALFFGQDFDRPLTPKGQHDAQTIATQLITKINYQPYFLSSPALRAASTAQAFATAFGVAHSAINYVNNLYHANQNTFYNEVSALPNQVENAILFSHNLGITHFVNSLQAGYATNNMEPCSTVVISIQTTTWLDFIGAKKKFLFSLNA
jgi:phosphohistidine phosphatase